MRGGSLLGGGRGANTTHSRVVGGERYRSAPEKVKQAPLKTLRCKAGGQLENGALPLSTPSFPSLGAVAPWPFSLFFCLYLSLLSVSGLLLYFSSSVPPPHQPLSGRSLPHTPSSSPASPAPTTHWPLWALKCVSLLECPMAPLTLCIPGITVWGHLSWSLCGGLGGPWKPAYLTLITSPHPSCSSQSQLCPAALPHPCLLTSPFFSLDGLPQPIRFP